MGGCGGRRVDDVDGWLRWKEGWVDGEEGRRWGRVDDVAEGLTMEEGWMGGGVWREFIEATSADKIGGLACFNGGGVVRAE